MVRGFLLLTFLAVSAASGENDAVTRIATIEARIGIATLNTGSGNRLDYRAEE
jgi:hypothetical protein